MLSGGIERHIKNISLGKDVHLTEGRLNNINLLANERQGFMKSLHKIRNSFKMEMRSTKLIAASKARKMVLNIFEDLKKLFKGEYTDLADQFNKIRYKLLREERLKRETNSINVTLETLNMEKDTFYDVNCIRYIDLLPDYDRTDTCDLKIDPQEIDNGNKMMNEVFSFYGGYA